MDQWTGGKERLMDRQRDRETDSQTNKTNRQTEVQAGGQISLRLKRNFFEVTTFKKSKIS
jgi:hypothetical protein